MSLLDLFNRNRERIATNNNSTLCLLYETGNLILRPKNYVKQSCIETQGYRHYYSRLLLERWDNFFNSCQNGGFTKRREYSRWKKNINKIKRERSNIATQVVASLFSAKCKIKNKPKKKVCFDILYHDT